MTRQSKRFAAMGLLTLLLVLAGAGVLLTRHGRAPARPEGAVHLDAPPAAVATLLADLQGWAPWGSDPTVRRTFGGAAGKAGATCYWSGGPGVGRGRLTLLAAGPSRLELEVELEEPRAFEADLTLSVAAEGQGTRVAWAIDAGRTGWSGWEPAPAPLEAMEAQLSRGLLALQPALEAARGERRVSRSTWVAARPGEVLERLADLRRWTAWLPEGRLDPSVRRSYGGPATGKGQSYYWAGNQAAGQGRLTILALAPDGVDVEREVERPLPSTADLELRVLPERDGARVTWTASGAASAGTGGEDPERALAQEAEDALAQLRRDLAPMSAGRSTD